MSSSSEAKNLEAIAKAIDQHNAKCSSKAKAVLLNPFEFERLGWDEIRGIPIKPDDGIGTGRLHIVCDGHHGPKKKADQEEAIEAPSAAERELVPAGVPEEGLPEWPGGDPIAEDLFSYVQWAYSSYGRRAS